MKNKILKFDRDCRNSMLEGINILSKAVSLTIGPAGRNVMLQQEYGSPASTKDGVTVARSINLKDAFENMGAQIVLEAAQKTNDEAGDGTTTATVLAQAIITEGLKNVENGSNPIELKRGIDKAVKTVVKKLKESSKSISDNKEIHQVAMISANNDHEIGTLISEAMDKVGRDGVITVEESKTAESYLEVVEGMQFNRGYLSPYFINSNEHMHVQLVEPYILLYDKKIVDAKSLVKVMEYCISVQKPLLIIAEDVEGAALSVLIVNKLRGSISVCAVKAPDFGERKNQVLEDLAIITGGRVISSDRGDDLSKFNVDPKISLDSLGQCRLVTIDNKTTTIIDGAGDIDKIKTRAEDLKKLIDNSSSDYETEKLQERIGKLSGGIAVIHMGAQTEVELKEKKDRVDDALHATRAAIDEGVIIGGGTALYDIATTLKIEDINDLQNEDQKFGASVILKAIKRPFAKITENAGLVAEVIYRNVEQERKEKNDNQIGYDVRNEILVNMIDAGIIDPAKVTRVALEKAASVAALFLTTECCLAFEPEKESKQQPMYDSQQGGYDM